MELGEKLPDFTLPDYDDRQVSSNDLIDDYVLLVLFIASDCELSTAYVGRVCKLINRYEGDNLGLIMIDCRPNRETYNVMEQRLAQNGLSFHHPDIRFVLDPAMQQAEIFDVQFTPTAFLFNQKRDLVYKGPIDDAGDNPTMITRVYLEDALENALDGLEIDFPEVQPYGTPIERVRGH